MASSIEAGTSLAHYRVLGPLGAGGMGEVYKAHDTRLERTVALKVLPPEMVRNEERRRRFVQEAKSASSLNHPHLITIHDIGVAVPSADGSTTDREPIHYIAMELVDGTTLGSRIHGEKVPLRTLLGYLAQAADGLAKAHAAGIIHRDLKPENIMVTRDGFAKVLDFGLAKLSPSFSATDPTIESPRDRTREGTLLGTVAYMSPEQVQGKEVDHRSDIFSFGSILYEAATRRRPFSADSDIELMHKILHDKPVAVDEIDPSVPSEVRRVIRRCMAKDPEKRYQSMKDLALELRDIADEYDDLAIAAGSRGSSSTPTVVTPVTRRKPLGWIAAGIAAILALIAAGVYLAKRDVDAPAVAATAAKSKDVEMRRVTSTGRVQNAAISPDGRYLAYGDSDGKGNESMHIRQIATGSDVVVAPSAPLRFSGVTFSPDGNYLYYSRTDPDDNGYSWLYQVPTLGGSARKVLHDVDTSVSFSPDGKQFVFGRGVPAKGENHFLVANADGSGERVLVTHQRSLGIFAPVWSPDGKTVATIEQVPPVGRFVKTVLVDVATGAKRDFGSPRWWWIEDLAWTADGKALLMLAMHEERGLTHVWRQPYPEGESVRLTSDLNNYADISVTADGNSIAVIAVDEKSDLRIADPRNPAVPPAVAGERARSVGDVSTSSRGSIVYEARSERSRQIAILDTPDAQPRLVTEEGINALPAVTADGRTIVFSSERDGRIAVYAVGPDGTGLRKVTAGDGEILDDISPDGTTIAYKAADGLWVRPLAGGTARKLTDYPRARSVFSTDSKTILYEHFSNDGGTTFVAVRIVPVAGGEPLLEVPWRGPRAHSWARHPEGFTFVTGADGGQNVFLLPRDGREPRQMTKFTSGTIRSHAWLPDGRVVLVRGEETSDVVLLTGF